MLLQYVAVYVDIIDRSRYGKDVSVVVYYRSSAWIDLLLEFFRQQFLDYFRVWFPVMLDFIDLSDKYYGQGKVSSIVDSRINITISPESAIAIIKKSKKDKDGN